MHRYGHLLDSAIDDLLDLRPRNLSYCLYIRNTALYVRVQHLMLLLKIFENRRWLPDFAW